MICGPRWSFQDGRIFYIMMTEVYSKRNTGNKNAGKSGMLGSWKCKRKSQMEEGNTGFSEAGRKQNTEITI